MRNLRLVLLPCRRCSSAAILSGQCFGNERLTVQTELKVLLAGCLLIIPVAVVGTAPSMRSSHIELQIDLGRTGAGGTVRTPLVRPEGNLVLKHDESGRQTHGILAQKVLPVEMSGQRIVVLEELVGTALLVADVALVVLLVEMLVQLGQVVEAPGTAELAQRMAGEAAAGTVAAGLMGLELGGGESGQLRHEIALGHVAQSAKRQVVLGAEMGVEGLHTALTFDLALLLGTGLGRVVCGLVNVCIGFVGKVTVGHAASQRKYGQDGGDVVVGGEEHTDVVAVGVSLAESVMIEDGNACMGDVIINRNIL